MTRVHRHAIDSHSACVVRQHEESGDDAKPVDIIAAGLRDSRRPSRNSMLQCYARVEHRSMAGMSLGSTLLVCVHIRQQAVVLVCGDMKCS